MTTVAEIFQAARALTDNSGDVLHPRYTTRFSGLVAGGIAHHGQVNLVKTDRAWVATIYILVTAPNKGVAKGFQAQSPKTDDALAELERLTKEWAEAA